MDKENFAILDTKLTTELIQEGLAREIVSKVQNMRKNSGFELTDRINLAYVADEEVAAAVEAFRTYIMEETLAVILERVAEAGAGFESWDINGHATALKVSKA
jgi:isoleucyl-tRNA synthetase